MIRAKASSSVFFTMCVLLMMATSAYADDAGGADATRVAPSSPDTQESREKPPIPVQHMKVGTHDIGAVDYYGDGMLMVIVPPHVSQKKKTTIPEAMGSLIHSRDEAKFLTAEKVGETIIIKAFNPSHR